MARRMGALCALPPPRAVGCPALGACDLHSTTWSLPETRPPSGRIWDVWLRHKAPGTPEAPGSKIVGLEMGFQVCALGCLRGWWVGRGHGAGAGLWGAGGLGESRPSGAIWNQAGAPRTCEAIWKKLRGPHGGWFRLPGPINLTVGHETPSERSFWTIVQTRVLQLWSHTWPGCLSQPGPPGLPPWAQHSKSTESC